jgi:hypothetical protein
VGAMVNMVAVVMKVAMIDMFATVTISYWLRLLLVLGLNGYYGSYSYHCCYGYYIYHDCHHSYRD